MADYITMVRDVINTHPEIRRKPTADKIIDKLLEHKTTEGWRGHAPKNIPTSRQVRAIMKKIGVQSV